MKKLVLRRLSGYSDNVQRIIDVCAAAGYEIDYHTAQFAWELHSKDYAASWMNMDIRDDIDLLKIILEYTEEL